VQSVIQQFQQQRNQLASQLNSASDAERQQILQQLSALREQLQSQLAGWQEQAFQQAQQMKSKFNNNFGPANQNPGAPGSSTGRPRP
jgi:hypothetical protein